jgi:hypothetical protein
MASTIIDPVASALATLVDNLSGVYGTKWTPKDLGTVPAGVVGVPRGSRVAVDTAESQLGSEDWNLTYTVALFFDLSEAQFSQAQAVEILEAFIAAVDDNPTLDGTVIDAKVTNFEPEVVETMNRPLLSYACDVDVLKLVQT